MGVEDIIFWKPPLEFFIFLLYPGNSGQNKAQPLAIPQNCVRSLGNSKAKNKDPWKFHIFVLGHSWNPTSFLINPWKFHMIISLIPTLGNSISSTLTTHRNNNIHWNELLDTTYQWQLLSLYSIIIKAILYPFT